MTLVSSDIAAGQRSFLFKDIYRTAEAIKLFKKEYQVYENAVETYENALQDWQDEYDRVKKENRRLKNSVNL
jgi:prefoldin subunit 5